MNPQGQGLRKRSTGATLALAILIGLSVLAPVRAEAAGTGSISGFYRGLQPSSPSYCYGGVTLNGPGGQREQQLGPQAFISGGYSFTGLEAGFYTLSFQAACRGELDSSESRVSSTYHSPVYVAEGSARTNINSLSGGGSITGKVTDIDGKPFAGICVLTYDENGNLGPISSTGPDGRYVVDELYYGQLRVGFSECVNRATTVIPEFYDGSATLTAAKPVPVTLDEETPDVNAQMERKYVPPPDPPPGEARIGKVSVTGPSRVKKGQKATYRLKIINTGDAEAIGVRYTAKAKGISQSSFVGKIPDDSSKTIRVELKPKKAGIRKLVFRVASTNAGGKTVERWIFVKARNTTRLK